MNSPPIALAQRLHQLVEQHLRPAHIIVDADGRVTGQGGALTDFGLTNVQLGDYAFEHLPVLAGLTPWAEETFGWVLDGSGRYMDVHIIPTEGGSAYVLFVASQLAQELRVELQQTGNTIALKQQRQEQVLESFVGRYVVDALLGHRLRLRADGERRVVTSLFCDIRRFTPFAELHSPSVVFAVLSEYLQTVLQPLDDHEGWIDKIAGDGVFAVFGLDPTLTANPARATAAALQIQQAIAALNRRRRAEDLPRLGVGIGISTGPVALGLLGTQTRQSFAVIGHHVNLAARLQASAGPGEIWIDGATHATLPPELQLFEPRMLYLKGLTDPVHVFRTYIDPQCL